MVNNSLFLAWHGEVYLCLCDACKARYLDEGRNAAIAEHSFLKNPYSTLDPETSGPHIEAGLIWNRGWIEVNGDDRY